MSTSPLPPDCHQRLENVFRDVLNDPELELRDEMSGTDIPGWDSFAHINTMFSIEQEFGIQFVGDEFARLESIGELKEILARKRSA
jgi:acyl carrier protein